MSHFAQVDENDIVVAVIVAEQDFIDSGAVGDPASWIQTSYNTRGGVHYGPDGKPDGGIALRANYASIGCFYDRVNDVFYAPKPTDLPTAILTGPPEWRWTFPIPRPAEPYKYTWSIEENNWVLKPEEEWGR
jgi:hypothetical protein